MSKKIVPLQRFFIKLMQITPNILTPQTRLVIFDLDGTLYAKPHMVWHMLFSAPNEWRLMWAERKTRKQLRGKWLGDENNNVLKQVAGKPLYKATLVKYADYICEKPYKQIKIILGENNAQNQNCMYHRPCLFR